MNSPLQQDPRIAKLDTPFGKDVLVLTRFDGHEGLGELFEYRIEALSEQEDLDFDKAIGRACEVTYKSYDKERVFNGILVEAEWLGPRNYYHGYRLVLRPWLWMLSQTADCRIFESMTAPAIIKQIFSDNGFSDVRDGLTESYEKLEYCVQYRETDLAFVSRLMEQHGIYYFFEHTAGKHTLVLADAKSSHTSIPACPTLPLIEYGVALGDQKQHVVHWSTRRRFRSGKVSFKDYDYLQPTADLTGAGNGPGGYNKSDMEIYDYPGKYNKTSVGNMQAKVMLEAEQALDQRRQANGDAANLFPGGLTSLEKHTRGSENQEYLVVRASHSISLNPFRSEGAMDSSQLYAGSYELQPSKRPFRSPLITPKPRIYGIQTAVVVPEEGNESEEIDVDEHGRILVRFHWVRPDKETKKKLPSCRLRVAQVWSGKKWGGQFIPRIGMEAVVEFLEGDPDRPLVVGTVYNKDYKVPYDLPANKTQSGIKSDSSKGHNGYNELVFEDKKSSEKITMHAEKDHDVVVRHAETWEIGETFEVPVGSPARKATIKKGDDVLKIESGNQDVDAAMMMTHKAGVMLKLEVGASKITMTPAFIKIESPLISLNGAMIMLN